MDSDTNAMTQAWADAEAKLPAGWQLDGLRCASTGLTPDKRSEEWIAVAIGPDGEERLHQAVEPASALSGLASSFEPTAK